MVIDNVPVCQAADPKFVLLEAQWQRDIWTWHPVGGREIEVSVVDAFPHFSTIQQREAKESEIRRLVDVLFISILDDRLYTVLK